MTDEAKYRCEGCEEDLPEDEFSYEGDGFCNDCVAAARETSDYRAWVIRGG